MSTLQSITEFMEPGMQLRSPGGFRFDPQSVVGVEVRGEMRAQTLTVHLASGRAVDCTFYDNHNGAAPDVYAVFTRIENAVNAARARAATPDWRIDQ